MNLRLRVGCPLWAHPSWGGLAAYARLCNAVEGNTTFYALPARTVAESWAEQTPADFRVVCKLPRTVTHDRRLRDVERPMRAFLDAIEPLGPRAHQWSVQLPASFGPDDAGVLAAFLRRLPQDRQVGVEVRHPDFFVDGPARTGLLHVLERAGADLVLLDSRALFAEPPTSDAEREAWSAKPRLPVLPVAVGTHPVVRVIGRDDVDRTMAAVRVWVPVVAAWLHEGRTPTVFVHTPDNVATPPIARAFHQWVRAEVPQVEPLPEPLPPATPEQPSLFD